MMNVFETLGLDLNRAWKATGYDNARLPDIAVQALANARLADHVALDDLYDACLQADTLPRQPNLDTDFGQPPLTVYADDQLYIEVLTWLDNTTSIHQHAFSGAFYVLAGSSLHTVYSFAETTRITHRMRLGTLALGKAERLQVGDLRPIHAGSDYIHALFHLGVPSATVVVRNYFEADKSPQYKYHRPSVALDDHHVDPLLKRQQQIFKTLARTDDPKRHDRLAAWMERADFESAFRMLLKLYTGGHVAPEAIPGLLATLDARHGEVAHHVAPVLHEEARVQRLMALRPSVTDAGHRLLLALMIASPGRDDAMRIIEEAYPDEAPARLVLRWLQEINAVAPASLSFADVQHLVGAPVAAAG